MPLTDWKNGITDTSQGHDLRLPFEDYLGQFQLRHYFFLSVPIPGGGPGQVTITRGFKFQLYDGPTMVMELDYELTLQVDYLAEAIFGTPLLSFLSYAVKKERFRTTMINGVATDAIDVINTQSTSGKITDYEGRELSEEEVAALENPSFIHTLGKTRSAEFGTVILDANGGVGTGMAVLDGRIELPVYRQNAGPETQLDIVFDSMSGAGRADRYQFRGGGVAAMPDISATIDIFGGVAVASLYGLSNVQLMYNPGGDGVESRGVWRDASNPSIMETPTHRLKLIGINKTTKALEEQISRNGGRSWELGRIIYKGAVGMPQAVTINQHTGETGLIAFEGALLVFRRSGDNYAGKTPIATFTKPEPMALTCSASGVLRAQNGRGLVFENRRQGGGPWANKSTVPIP
jgi:hypothetical protein